MTRRLSIGWKHQHVIKRHWRIGGSQVLHYYDVINKVEIVKTSDINLICKMTSPISLFSSRFYVIDISREVISKFLYLLFLCHVIIIGEGVTKCRDQGSGLDRVSF